VGDNRLFARFAVEFEGALLLDNVVELTLEADDGFEDPPGFDVELGPNLVFADGSISSTFYNIKR
jgi:hypothetical protein